MDYVKDLTDLNVLNLGSTRVTGIGLAKLATLKNLTDIDLRATKIEDADLAVVQHWPRLRYLAPWRTPRSLTKGSRSSKSLRNFKSWV